MPHVARSLPDAELLLKAAAALPRNRLTRMIFRDQTYFVKMAEVHDQLRLRLMKGAPDRALERERELLQAFAARGAHVAQVVAADDARVILADHGAPVERPVRAGEADAALLRRIGQALAELHALGLAHGRPALRDLCWDGAEMTFLDLEAEAKLQAQDRDKARDLFILLHSVVMNAPDGRKAAERVLEGYQASAGPQLVEVLRKRAARLWWMQIAAAPGVWLHRLRGKKRSEFAAIAPTRALIADWPAVPA